MKLFSDMTREELEHEIKRLNEERLKYYQRDEFSKAAIMEQKYYLARSYLMDPKTIKIGEKYRIEKEHDALFTVDYLNGVMAWGKFEGETEPRAFPLARLTPIRS